MTNDADYVPAATPDLRDDLLAKLKDLLPGAFPDGELDATALLDALQLEDERKPGFLFSWPGIEQARDEAQSPTTATLVPDRDASVGFEHAGDVLIEGDNLQVLKLLKNGYSGAVKLIYIDPPYNTGDSFTYNDDFSAPESEYLRSTGQLDEHGNATTSRLETGGRKHAPWLTMMFARLVVARDLLKRDGVFLASIDNNEVHHLRLLLDAVFGAENFVDMMTWRGARKGDAKLTGGGQDYILVYARDRSWLRSTDVRWRERKAGLEPIYAKEAALRNEFGEDYESATRELRAWFKSLADEDPSKAHDYYNRVDAKGVWFPDNISSPNYRENLTYDWKGYSPPANGWRYEKPTMERLDAEGRLIYPADMSKRVQIKSYLHMRETWAPSSVFYQDRRSASKALTDLMEGKVFDDPKSTDVLARLFHSLTADGDLILDFFAGSGSSAQAVWEQNPRDEKTRHWVLVQRPELPNSSEESGKNAIEAGYETIFEITAERLRRAASKLQQDTLGAPTLGFRVFRTRPSNLVIEAPIVATAELTGQGYFDMIVQRSAGAPVEDGAREIDVAWEVALKATDTKLDARVVEHLVAGASAYEFIPTGNDERTGRVLVALGEFTLMAADELGLTDDDVLILRGDKVDDSVTLTLAPRLQSKLILLERVPREVSL